MLKEGHISCSENSLDFGYERQEEATFSKERDTFPIVSTPLIWGRAAGGGHFQQGEGRISYSVGSLDFWEERQEEASFSKEMGVLLEFPRSKRNPIEL